MFLFFFTIFLFCQVSGYGDKASNSEKGSAVKDSGESFEEGSTLSSFRALADMLLSLTNNDGDGRIIISRRQRTSFGQQGGFLKYVMLTGEKIFSEVWQKFLYLWLNLDLLHNKICYLLYNCE